MPNADLPYDFEDFGWDASALERKYGGDGHPHYTVQQWRDCPDEEEAETNGYYDWVRFKIEQDDDATPSTDEAIEQQIQDKGLNAPRISLAHVQSMKLRIGYRFEQPEGTTVTFCHAFLDGSFYLASGTSACVSPENFDEQIGRDAAMRDALDKATDKLYELEGYRLWTEVQNA